MVLVENLKITFRNPITKIPVGIYYTDENGTLDVPLPPGDYEMVIADQAIPNDSEIDTLSGFSIQKVTVRNARLNPSTVVTSNDTSIITVVESVNTDIAINFIEDVSRVVPTLTLTVAQKHGTDYYPELVGTFDVFPTNYTVVEVYYAYTDISGNTTVRSGILNFFNSVLTNTFRMEPGFVAELIGKHVDVWVNSIPADIVIAHNAVPMIATTHVNIAIPAVTP